MDRTRCAADFDFVWSHAGPIIPEPLDTFSEITKGLILADGLLISAVIGYIRVAETYFESNRKHLVGILFGK